MSYKAGFVGVIGLPNMGKSSLVNQLIGEKVSIVTEKPQTTRKSKVGVFSDDRMQALFVDAPGFVKASKGLNQFLSDEAGNVFDSSDILMLVVTTEISDFQVIQYHIDQAKKSGKKWFVVINKMDTNLSRRVLFLEDKLKEQGVSYFKHSTLDKDYDQSSLILEEVFKNLPESGAPLYDTDSFTTSITREWVEEIIREKCFQALSQELPYNLTVKVKKFLPAKGKNITKIFTDIIVSKKNHCSIVIGTKGSKIKEIGSKSRKDIEDMLGEKVYLELFTKVKPSWMENKSFMKEMGYVVKQ